MFVLRFSVLGEDQVLRTFSRWTEGVSDFSPVFEGIADDFLAMEQRQFDTEGKAGSGGWAPLSPRYAAWKAQHFPGGKILEWEGWLKKSLTEKDAPFAIRDIQPKQVVLGTDVPYAGFHQSGTAKMPARPPIELAESDKGRWSKMVHEWLYNMAKGL